MIDYKKGDERINFYTCEAHRIPGNCFTFSAEPVSHVCLLCGQKATLWYASLGQALEETFASLRREANGRKILAADNQRLRESNSKHFMANVSLGHEKAKLTARVAHLELALHQIKNGCVDEGDKVNELYRTAPHEFRAICNRALNGEPL